VEFVLSDRMEKFNGIFDLVLSNPPYIKRVSDKGSVHTQTLEHEPDVALFLDDENYEEWFLTFFNGLKLRKGGKFICEGHENHLYFLRDHLMNNQFDHITIEDDLAQRPRIMTWIN